MVYRVIASFPTELCDLYKYVNNDFIDNVRVNGLKGIPKLTLNSPHGTLSPIRKKDPFHEESIPSMHFRVSRCQGTHPFEKPSKVLLT